MKTKTFWMKEGFSYLIPKGFGEFPEGFDVRGLLKSISDQIGYQSVIDFGCGYGRLCESFDKEKYLGIDINALAIEEAKKRFSNYRFTLATEKLARGADLYLAYALFLHLKDKEVHEILKLMKCKWLIVAEMLGREWREEGLPPMFNRDLSDYIHLLRKHDFVLEEHIKKGYTCYERIPWNRGKNTKLSFLIFRKYFPSRAS